MASLATQPSKKAIQSPGSSSTSHRNCGSSGQTVKFARRISSGRYVNLSREDLDMFGELSGDYINYTVHIPPTPHNQPMDTSVAAKAEEQYISNSLFTGGFNSVTRAHLMDKVIDSEVTHPQMAGAKGSSCSMPACDGKVMKDERGADVIPCECRDCFLDVQKESGICPGCKESYRMGDYDDNSHDFYNDALPLPAPGSSKRDPKNMSMMKRNHTGDFDHNRWLFETKGMYSVGNAFWPRDDVYGNEGLRGSMMDAMDKPWKPLSRRLPIPASIISRYRLLILVRLVVLGFFLHWRVKHPNVDEVWLWLMSVVCEISFAFSWILDQIPKLCPINRSTDLKVLYDKFDAPSLMRTSDRKDPGPDNNAE